MISIGVPHPDHLARPVGSRGRFPHPTKGASQMAKHRRLPGGGRHRPGPYRAHCRNLAAVRSRLAETRSRRWFGLRLGRIRMGGRHTAAALTRSGARPRPAFVLIASL